MKMLVKNITAVCASVAVLASLSSCTLFKTMRENALNVTEPAICDTPAENMLIDDFNSFVAASLSAASKVTENISFEAGNPEVKQNGENAGLLADAAKQLKALIMSEKPGKSSREIGASDESLLTALDKAAILSFSYDRNYNTETVTNEKGNDTADEDGNAITVTSVSDNVLHLTVNYFDSMPASGSENEEETTLISAQNATIESVFGSLRDKQAVISQFDCVKDYLELKDYSLSYTACKITADIDLSTQQVLFVRFEKCMNVSANVTAVGALAAYGELQVALPLTEVTNYEFSFETAENAE